MPRILINHNESLETDDTLNVLKVDRSLKSGTALEIHSDGLYAPKQNGTSSGGYPDFYYSDNRLRTGVMYATDVDNTHSLSGRVVAPVIVHRIFTCTQTDGSDIDLRQVTDGGVTHNIDMILPGDMFRVLDSVNNVYNYYLILTTNGNVVSSCTPSPVATVPVSVSCN
jgi:hypothetical protein